MVKVYCKNCKYFNDFGTNCNASKNIEWNENYYSIYKIYIKNPETINKNNDCKWYQERWYFKTILDFFKYIARIK